MTACSQVHRALPPWVMVSVAFHAKRGHALMLDMAEIIAVASIHNNVSATKSDLTAA